MSLEVTKLRAVAHPVRLQMLSLLTGAALSAAEIARELDITQANASYHLRVLASAGEVVAAGEEKIRGGVAKRYRHPWQNDAGQARPGSREPRSNAAFIQALAQELIRRNAARAPDTVGYVSDAEVWVPSDAWDEALDLVRRASELVHERAQPPRTPHAVHVNLTAVLFQLAEGTAPVDR